MTISLLHIVVPTILVLVILILYINSSGKKVTREIGELRTQLEKMDNLTVTMPPAEMQHESFVQVQDVTERVEESAEQKETGPKEEKDAVKDVKEKNTDIAASAYNTGKSGKIYTKEELELLIKE